MATGRDVQTEMQTGKRPFTKACDKGWLRGSLQGLSTSAIRARSGSYAAPEPGIAFLTEPGSHLPGVSNLRHARQICGNRHTSCLRNTFRCPLEIGLGFWLWPFVISKLDVGTACVEPVWILHEKSIAQVTRHTQEEREGRTNPARDLPKARFIQIWTLTVRE